MAYQPNISPLQRPRQDRMASYYNDAQRAPVTSGSPSMTDDPSMTRDIQGAKRDRSLLIRQYNQLRRRGDYAGAMGVVQQADKMGLPVGRPSNDDQIQAAGSARYYDGLRRTGAAPRPGGLAGADFRHSKDGGAGVGGYDFNQQGAAASPARPRFGYQGTESPSGDGSFGPESRDRPVPMPETRDKPVPMPDRGIPEGFSDSRSQAAPQAQGSPPPSLKRRPSGASIGDYSFDQQGPESPLETQRRGNMYRKEWRGAKTDEERAAIIRRAMEDDIPITKAGIDAMQQDDEKNNIIRSYPDPVKYQGADKTAGWNQRWDKAKTQEEKDFVVSEAARHGIPMTNAGRAALERRKSGPLPPPATGAAGAQGAQGAPGQAAESQEPDLNTPEGRLANMKRQIAAGTYDQFTKPEVDREVRTERMFSRVADLGRGLRREFQREWREAGSRQMDEINRKSPGWDDPAAYAAARRGEVADLQRRNLESVGKFQKGLKEEIVTGGNDKIPLIQIQKADGTRESIVDLVPEGKSRDILMDSIKKFGNLHNLTPKEAEEAAIAKLKARNEQVTVAGILKAIGEDLSPRVEYRRNDRRLPLE